MKSFYPPEFEAKQFNCPHCNVYSSQSWTKIMSNNMSPRGGYPVLDELRLCTCTHCNKKSYWYNEKLIIPDVTSAPPAHNDMPKEIKEDYEEAASILNKSPRGAAALLRLALQKLMKELGESGKDINKDIGSLVKKGLPIQVQQALDIVRVIGNESVHPGTLDIKDDIETASQLFDLINFIVEDRITKPLFIKNFFEKLPVGKKKGIESRDTIKTP
jgi:Domain of unknown function (DUF4145)